MPGVIPPLAKPVSVRPLFGRAFQLPRAKAETGLTSFRQIPGHANQFLVLHQRGLIWRVEKTAAGEEVAVFADLKSEVFSERGPNGLLDVAFHPKSAENRQYHLFCQVFEDGSIAKLLNAATTSAAARSSCSTSFPDTERRLTESAVRCSMQSCRAICHCKQS